jgi:tetratricopeptide (TPR) repeat protein
LGRYEEGLAAAEKATALWPTDPDGWVCTIAASRHLGRGTGTALEIANALVARHPDLPAAWEGLSDILYRFDRFDESLKALVSWERLAPGCADALRTRSARIREATRSGQPGEPDWVRNSRGPSDER